MNLSEIKIKPKLIELSIDDKQTVEDFGDSITLYMMDQVDLQTYFDFYRKQSEGKPNELMDVLRKILRDKDGKPVLQDDETIPLSLVAKVIEKVGEQLGKSATPNSRLKETGTQATS